MTEGGVPGGDVSALAAALGPALIEQAGGRLSPIEWFRSTWQRGGAATGFAKWRTDEDGTLDVVVKLPVGPAEYRWTTQLGSVERWGDAESLAIPTPRVVAAGHAVGGYDLAWLIIERLDGHTLASQWGREHVEELLRTAADLHARAARAGPPGKAPPAPEWDKLIARGREAVREAGLPEAQRWNEALKRVQKVLDRIAPKWAARSIDTWCHGDLHPGNAMHRAANGQCVLIDLALVHPGNWIEDAVYLERQFWGKPEQLHGIHPVSLLAGCRRERGLPTVGDYGSLANLRRTLMAACVPAFLAREGHPRYVHAALETLEKLLPQVSK